MGRRPLCLVCLLLIAVMCLADLLGFPLIRGNPLPESVRQFISQHPEAVICGEVQRCQETEFSQSIYLKQVYLSGSEQVSIGNVRVFLKNYEKVPAGTFVVVSGKLERVDGPSNPGEFDKRQYYACQHIYYFLKDGKIEKRTKRFSVYRQFLLDVRDRLSDSLEKTAGAYAPVFQAMLLGVKENLDEEQKMRFQLAGIIHILAISGLHISLLGMGLFQLLQKAGMGLYLSGMIALSAMLQYGLLTGENVSTMRAVCMFLLLAGARISGRIYDRMTAVALSAILLFLESPAYLYSSSFLLSFGAVLGVGAAAPVLCEIAGAESRLEKSLIFSAAVQLTTLPVLLFFYGEVSLVGVILNLAVLPTVGIVLASGAICAMLSFFWPFGAAWAALPGRGLLFCYEKLCVFAGKLPFCTWIAGAPAIWQAAVYYAAFLGALYLGWKCRKRVKELEKRSRKKKRSFFRRIFPAAAVFLLTGTGIFAVSLHPAGKLAITCLDVGQGDGIVMETPENHHILLDFGSSSRSETGRYILLPYLKNQGISRLEGILVSHTDEDHIGGIRELLTFVRDGLTSLRVDTLILPEWEDKPKAYLELESLAEETGIPVRTVCSGDSFGLDGVSFRFLSPEKNASGKEVNEQGMVTEVHYRDFYGLFTGDIGEKTERRLLPELSDVDFLKVPHHGSRYSASQEFLEKTNPEIAVISCSETNLYGHPSPDTVKRLEKSGCQVEYTMKSGAVTLRTDGKQMEIIRFRRLYS